MNGSLKCKILEGELKGKRITIKFVCNMPDDIKSGPNAVYHQASITDIFVYLDDKMQTNVTGIKIEASVDDNPIPQITLNMIDL